MTSYIHIRRIPYEEPYHLRLQIRASNGRQTAFFEFYVNADALLEFADALEVFPKHASDVFLYECGSERPEVRFAFFFRFRAFLTDRLGNCAIQLRFNNNEDLPERELSEFCVHTEPAQLNRLGQLFRSFAQLEDPVLEWSPTRRVREIEDDA